MPTVTYDYERFSFILTDLASTGVIYELLEPGDWIQDDQDIHKFMFDSFQEDDDHESGFDKNLMCFVIFIHKNCLEKGFVYPHHEYVHGVMQHRPEDEAALIGWYDKKNDSWSWLPIEACNSQLSADQIMEFLEGIWKLYWGYDRAVQ